MTSPRQERTRAVLASAVRRATGLPDALPRPGQIDLADDMAKAADPLGGYVAGIAPTGVGKSLVSLSVAAVGAADYDERWVISTESISLQSQYLDKDAPVVVDAVREVTGKDIHVAVLKGWSNYLCALRTKSAAADFAELPPYENNWSKVADVVKRTKRGAQVEIDGFRLDTARVQPLLDWALRQHGGDGPGDRGSYPGQLTDQDWAAFSVSTQECIGEDQCPMAIYCKPLAARENAAAADIVVTNHSMLAVQAANAVPVVIGSNKLGPFQGIIVDEAHTLPGEVRKQGQSTVSGRRIGSVSRLARGVLNDRFPVVQKWVDDGKAIAESVDADLAALVPTNADGPQRIADDADPLANTGDMLEGWLKRGQRLVAEATKNASTTSATIKGKRATAALDKALRDIDTVREHRVGTARWLEAVEGVGVLAQAAPVMVSGLLQSNLWTETMKPATADGETEAEVRELTVAAISATLPSGFERDAAIKAQSRSYASPFDTAYGSSMLFIPRAVDEADVNAITAVSRWNNRRGFDTAMHAEWSAGIAEQLVEANGGSAIILTSTVANGKKYVERLRRTARGRWKVYSQWDGESARRVVAAWRSDERSVLVGTRSLMTGVDAPGETNTLVIVDRIPRAASNPVDDARVEALAEALGGDKWAADRLVYVADATLLLEQALGRLIRSVSDSGMAAILDPRLLNAGPYSYQKPVRNAYAKAYGRFERKTSRLPDALAFLRQRKGSKR